MRHPDTDMLRPRVRCSRFERMQRELALRALLIAFLSAPVAVSAICDFVALHAIAGLPAAATFGLHAIRYFRTWNRER